MTLIVELKFQGSLMRLLLAKKKKKKKRNEQKHIHVSIATRREKITLSFEVI